MRPLPKILWTGVLFVSVPFLTVALHILLLGTLAESSASLPYLPLWMALMGGMSVPVATAFTAAVWFMIGGVVGAVIHGIMLRRSRIGVCAVFGLTMLVIIASTIPELLYLRRITGTGYTLEECRDIDPDLHAGSDRSRCVKNVAIQMINDADPAVDETLCNSLVENDTTMGYCWAYLARQKGTSPAFCDAAPDEVTKGQCIAALAEKLLDERLCQMIKTEYGVSADSCVRRVQEVLKWKVPQ